MRTKLLIFVLIITALACASMSTPISPSIPLDDMVQTAAADIAVKTAQAAALQASPIPAAVDTPIPTPFTAQLEDILGKVGETITQNGYIITLFNVETATQYGDFFQAAVGNKFISVELLIESGAPSGVSANPFYATIKDVNGYAYSFTVFGKEPTLQSQNDMPMGEKMRGWITFEIPQTATNLVLIYEPITFSNAVRIRFDLGQ